MLLEKVKENRYSGYLRQRYRAILGYTGLIWAIAGVVILSPLLALIFYCLVCLFIFHRLFDRRNRYRSLWHSLPDSLFEYASSQRKYISKAIAT